jgi:hypothetical protein
MIDVACSGGFSAADGASGVVDPGVGVGIGSDDPVAPASDAPILNTLVA